LTMRTGSGASPRRTRSSGTLPHTRQAAIQIRIFDCFSWHHAIICVSAKKANIFIIYLDL
jgi:hypothetical protein